MFVSLSGNPDPLGVVRWVPKNRNAAQSVCLSFFAAAITKALSFLYLSFPLTSSSSSKQRLLVSVSRWLKAKRLTEKQKCISSLAVLLWQELDWTTVPVKEKGSLQNTPICQPWVRSVRDCSSRPLTFPSFLWLLQSAADDSVLTNCHIRQNFLPFTAPGVEVTKCKINKKSYHNQKIITVCWSFSTNQNRFNNMLLYIIYIFKRDN